MAEVDDFLAELMPRQLAADTDLHNGDAGPRLGMWSRTEPLTVFGAMMSGVGWRDIEPMFVKVAAMFSDCTSYEYEVVAAGASGDLAYTVGYEHTSATVNGEPTSYTLRVTQVYRREDGTWKVVHRHADRIPDAGGAPPR